MKFMALVFFIALSILVGVNSAQAISFDVVMTKDGGIVLSSSGDCVRTMWMSDKDVCPTYELFQEEMQEMLKSQKGIVNFDFNSSLLKDSEKPKLDSLVELFHKYNVKNIRIYGYTDKIGGDHYNLNLSQKRALVVYDYLQSKLNVKQDYELPIDLKGMGKAGPVQDCSHEAKGHKMVECLYPNRRTEVEMDYLETEIE